MNEHVMIGFRHWLADQIEAAADILEYYAEILLHYLRDKSVEVRPTYWTICGSMEGSKEMMCVALTTDSGPAEYTGEYADDRMVRNREHTVLDVTYGPASETEKPEIEGRTLVRSPDRR